MQNYPEVKSEHLIESYNIIRDINEIKAGFYNPNAILPYILGDFVELKDGLRYYKINDIVENYSFEDYIINRFTRVLLFDDLDITQNLYFHLSIVVGDFKGYIQAIMRKVQNIKTNINNLQNFERKNELIAICNEFKPELIKRGINAENLEISEQASKVKVKAISGMRNLQKSFMLDGNNAMVSIDILKKHLLQENKIHDSTTKPNFRKAFMGKKIGSIKKKIIWTGTIGELKYFINALKDCNKIDKRNNIWQITIELFQSQNGELLVDQLQHNTKRPGS